MNTTHQRNVANNMIDLIDTLIGSPSQNTKILPPVKLSLKPVGSLSSARPKTEKYVAPVKSSYISASEDSSSPETENITVLDGVRLTPSAIRDRLREIEKDVRDAERKRSRRIDQISELVLDKKNVIISPESPKGERNTPSSQIIESYGDSGKTTPQSGKSTPVVETKTTQNILTDSDSDTYSESIIQPLAHLVRNRENDDVVSEPLLRQIRQEDDDSDSDDSYIHHEDSTDSESVDNTYSEIKTVRIARRDIFGNPITDSSRRSVKQHDPLSPTESSITLSPEIQFVSPKSPEKKTQETHVTKPPSSKEKSESGTKVESRVLSEQVVQKTDESVVEQGSIIEQDSIIEQKSVVKQDSIIEQKSVVEQADPDLNEKSDSVDATETPEPVDPNRYRDKYQVIIDIVEYTIITIDFFNKIIYYLVHFIERNIIGTESAYTIYSRLKPVYDVFAEFVMYKISAQTAKIISKNRGKYGL